MYYRDNRIYNLQINIMLQNQGINKWKIPKHMALRASVANRETKKDTNKDPAIALQVITQTEERTTDCNYEG